MAVVVSILLVLVGLSGLVAPALWRRGRWLPSARWIYQYVSPAAVVATPVVGLLIICTGLMLVWPPAVLLSFLMAFGLILALGAASRGGRAERLFPAIAEASGDPPVQRIEPTRRAS